jgi:hypothetical protein
LGKLWSDKAIFWSVVGVLAIAFERFYREPALYSQEIAQYNAFFSRFQLVKELGDGGYDVKIYAVATN